MAAKPRVIRSKVHERFKVARVELSCAFQISSGVFPVPLPSLDETHHLKYARVVGKSLASDFQFGQRAVIIAITSIEMYRLCEVRFARIRLQTKSGIDRVFRHGQPRWGTVDPIEIKLIMGESQLAIRIQKRWVARDSPVQQLDCLPIIRIRDISPKK